MSFWKFLTVFKESGPDMLGNQRVGKESTKTDGVGFGITVPLPLAELPAIQQAATPPQQPQRKTPMKLSIYFSLIGSLVTMADGVLEASGVAKLEAVGTAMETIRAKVGSELDSLTSVAPVAKGVANVLISAFADLKHTLEAAVDSVEGKAPAATPAQGQVAFGASSLPPGTVPAQ
jgi:hypothetical protein